MCAAGVPAVVRLAAAVPDVRCSSSRSFETNKYYQPGLLDAEDVWVGDAVASGATRSVPFTLTNVAASGSAALEVVLEGASESGMPVDHHLSVALNGVFLGEAKFALAGGAENMSQAPHADFKSRFGGVKLGSLQLEDMLQSALTDEYIGCGMGVTAENLAKKYAISREDQDEYALLSHERAEKARNKFSEEIVAVEVSSPPACRHLPPPDTFLGFTALERASRLSCVT